MENSFIDLAGDEFNSKGTSKFILEELNRKYGITFEVLRIGNRYGNGTFNSVTTYCCPASNKKAVFTATLNMDNKVIDDDYEVKYVTAKLEQQLYEVFLTNGIETISKVEVVGKNKLDKAYSVDEFISSFPNLNFLAYIITKSHTEKNELLDSYKRILDVHPNIYLKTLIFEVDLDSYKDIQNLAETIPELSTSIIRRYNIISESIIKIQDNKIKVIE